MDAVEAVADQVLADGFAFEWTDLTYQEILAGNSAVWVFPLAILLVFLVLAAQYESWSLPLAIILIVPMCLLSAIAGIAWMGMDNNILTQIGLVVLVGLAAKNAILIVEFARQGEQEGLPRQVEEGGGHGAGDDPGRHHQQYRTTQPPRSSHRLSSWSALVKRAPV